MNVPKNSSNFHAFINPEDFSHSTAYTKTNMCNCWGLLFIILNYTLSHLLFFSIILYPFLCVFHFYHSFQQCHILLYECIMSAAFYRYVCGLFLVFRYANNCFCTHLYAFSFLCIISLVYVTFSKVKQINI